MKPLRVADHKFDAEVRGDQVRGPVLAEVKLRAFADIDPTHFHDDETATDSRLLKGVMADPEQLVGGAS